MTDSIIRISVDLETMSLENNAAILQISAVTLDLKKEFNILIAPEAYEYCTHDRNFDIDKATMEWWDKQDPNCRNRVFSGTTTPAVALGLFSDWVAAISGGQWKNVRLYSKGSKDWYWLENAFLQCHGSFPFHYRSECSMRSLQDAVTYAGYTIPPFPPTEPHYALADAIAQAKEISWCLNALRVGAH